MIEVCCGSYEDAAAAWEGGAKRIELNSALYLGGITPTEACVRLVKENTGLKVISMVRPRGAGFCYTEAQRLQMFAEARGLLEAGSDGLAFGFLTERKEIDRENTGKMTELIHSYGGEAVFHRAFDCLEDPEEGIQALIEAKVDRLLTSGQGKTAWEGIPLLRQLVEKWGNRIQIQAGSGVTVQNARELVRLTGVTQLHSSCKTWIKDPTTQGPLVSYRFAGHPNEEAYDGVSSALVRALVEQGL